MLPTFWLSCHVGYACRHSGACCASGWPLPVEARVVPSIDAAVADGRLTTIDRSVIWLRESAEAPEDMAGTFRLVNEACVFHLPRESNAAVSAGGRHCAVHATLGHGALPPSCQHFPRVCLVDARGVRVALSHYCPTAAAMLVDDARPVTIVRGPAAVPGVDVPEGLDVRDELPPRLSDRVLMDLDALTAWEAHVVHALAGPAAWPGSVDDVLARLALDAEWLMRWTPGESSLVAAVLTLADRAAPAAAVAPRPVSAHDSYAHGRAACRGPWMWPALPDDFEALDARWVASSWPYVAPVVRRYLAGKAFGAWVTHQVGGTRSLVSWLALARTVLRVECVRTCAAEERPLDRERLIAAVRQADLLLVHYADSALIADAIAGR